VPGEWYSPTQPFPTKPPPFERQGLTLDDVVDFTPDLKAEAVGIAKQYVFGPLYTPPSIKSDAPGGTRGTLLIPSWIGGGNWDGAAFDPDTHRLYVPSMTGVFLIGLKKGDAKSKYAYEIDGTSDVLGPRGLPLTKPPYGRLTAIDMDQAFLSRAGRYAPSCHRAMVQRRSDIRFRYGTTWEPGTATARA